MPRDGGEIKTLAETILVFHPKRKPLVFLRPSSAAFLVTLLKTSILSPVEGLSVLHVNIVFPLVGPDLRYLSVKNFL